MGLWLSLTCKLMFVLPYLIIVVLAFFLLYHGIGDTVMTILFYLVLRNCKKISYPI